jgi:Family of unknown function (DUF6912)
MRVFLPLTLTSLAAVHRSGQLPAGNGHAATSRLRAAWADADEEDCAYAALMAAGYDSLLLLAADPSAPPRRVVVAADVASAQGAVGAASADLTAVVVAAPVPLMQVAAIHVDDVAAAADVRAAIAAVPAATTGDGAALDTVDLGEHELQWFATQELPDLLA